MSAAVADVDETDVVHFTTFASFVFSVALAADDMLMAAGSVADGVPEIRLWLRWDDPGQRAYSARPFSQDDGLRVVPSAMALTRGGTALASGFSDGTINVHTVHRHAARATPQRSSFAHGGVSSSVETLAFSPRGDCLLSASDSLYRLWDLDGRRLAEVEVDGGDCLPRGKRATWSEDGSRCMLFDPTDAAGRFLFFAHGAAEPLKPLGTWPFAEGLICDFDLSPDGRWLAVATLDNGAFVLDLVSGQLRPLPAAVAEAPAFSVAYSPDGEHLAVGQTGSLWLVNALHPDAPQRQVPLPAPHGDSQAECCALSFSPSGRHLGAAFLEDGSIFLADLWAHMT